MKNLASEAFAVALLVLLVFITVDMITKTPQVKAGIVRHVLNK